ncbi:efflux RND transporter periplasmic adaptor subunit [Vibrio ponticus]|uniref:Efflux RND transporter periplasmic adaptor subunit n=2 Tax=Vibrio ponticus TaxID=265668 RepID=A0A3N3DW35_9VIBR|nr:efflux RND transporter periplasmic adaptor subunit [Vibrio ponticus]
MILRKYSSLFLTVAVLSGCGMETEHRPKPSLTVDVLTLDAPISEQHRVFNGVVEAADLTPLAFRIEGELTQILVKEGDAIASGQPIALLNNQKYQQNLNNAQARFDLASKQLERAKDLYRQAMISKAQFDELSATFKLAKAQRDTAKTMLSYARLNAPFDGVISSVEKQSHESVTPGEVVVTLYRPDQLHVKINISDTILALMDPTGKNRTYQPYVAFAGSQKRHPMQYLEHTTELHPQSRSYEFWLSREQLATPVLPGSSAIVYVDMTAAGMGTHQGYLIPMTALDAGQKQGQFYIWKLQDERAYRYPITVDEILGNGAIVSLGVAQGDVIISSNIRKLREGMEIKGVHL